MLIKNRVFTYLMIKEESKSEGRIKRMDPEDPKVQWIYEMLGWKKDGRWII